MEGRLPELLNEIYIEIKKKKQYINNIQLWHPVWGFTHLMQISVFQRQISSLINTDICIFWNYRYL